VQILSQAVAHALDITWHLDCHRLDRVGREGDLLQGLRRPVEHVLADIPELEARLDLDLLLGEHGLVDWSTALGRPRLEAAVLVAEQEAAADPRRQADHWVEGAEQIELAEEALHGHAVQREPDLGDAQVEQAADDVALFEAAELVGVDGLGAAGVPEVGAVEAERVDVVAYADGAEAVGAVGSGLEVGVGPADAAVGSAV